MNAINSKIAELEDKFIKLSSPQKTLVKIFPSSDDKIAMNEIKEGISGLKVDLCAIQSENKTKQNTVLLEYIKKYDIPFLLSWSLLHMDSE